MQGNDPQGNGVPVEKRTRQAPLPLAWGLSTGRKTDKGKARIAEAQRKRWAERREVMETPENT